MCVRPSFPGDRHEEPNTYTPTLAMTATQARIADTIEIFYGAADRNSDSGMAGHAYKRSVDELDSSFTRELVCHSLAPTSGDTDTQLLR